MKRYIEHMQDNRTPHERRQFAMQIAGVVTAALFVGWITTLGVRIATSEDAIAGDSANQTANTLQAVQGSGNATILR